MTFSIDYLCVVRACNVVSSCTVCGWLLTGTTMEDVYQQINAVEVPCRSVLRVDILPGAVVWAQKAGRLCTRLHCLRGPNWPSMNPTTIEGYLSVQEHISVSSYLPCKRAYFTIIQHNWHVSVVSNAYNTIPWKIFKFTPNNFRMYL